MAVFSNRNKRNCRRTIITYRFRFNSNNERNIRWSDFAMERFEFRKQTSIHTNKQWSWKFPIYGNVSRSRLVESYSNTKNNNNKFSHRHNFNVHTIIKKLCLLLATSAVSVPAYAEVGGISATANPIANSSGSVTNQAIQVLQGPYITNTYGGGIQCQGPTMNLTPYANGSVSYKKPFESMYLDPVYNNADNNDDSIPDNPGQILYEIPTRTGQKDNYTLSLGFSATWSKPLDKELQAQCKEAAAANIDLMEQAVANKRLDFEIARLKNCGELKKAGNYVTIQSTPYYSVVC